MPWPEMAVSDSYRMFKSKLRFQIRHGDFRQRISQDEEDIQSILNWYNSADGIFLNHLSQDIRGTNSSAVWRYLIAYKNLLRAIENIGIAVVYGIRYYGKGSITNDNYVQFIRHDTLGFEYIEQSQNFVAQVRKDYEHLTVAGKDMPIIMTGRKDILSQKEQNPDPKEALRYYMATFNYTEDLRVVLQDLRLRIVEIVKNELSAANQQQAFGIAVLILVLIISPIIIFLVRNATVTIQIFSLSLSKKARELRLEKKKAVSLTFQMLPKPIIKDFQSRRDLSAKKFDSVTVFFSDIADFQKMIHDNTPDEMVIFLNVLYKMFDYQMEKFQVFKVDTVNDSHMVASGLPTTNGDKHIKEVADFALAVLDSSVRIIIKQRPKHRLQMRGSIHTGSVIAGVQHLVKVVGSKMPRYRIFGQTVDFVADMNAFGEAMRVQVSQESKILLETTGGYKIQEKGIIKLPDGEEVNTWWLLGKDIQNVSNFVTGYEGLPTRLVVDGKEEPEFMKDLAEYSFTKVLDTDRQKTISDYYSPA